MKITVLSIALSLILFSSCKKDKVADPGLTSMESGVYSGKYVSQNAGVIDTRYQFRVAINQINDSTYTIQQLDAGILPDFNMIYGAVLGTGTTTKLKFRIPIQND